MVPLFNRYVPDRFGDEESTEDAWVVRSEFIPTPRHIPSPRHSMSVIAYLGPTDQFVRLLSPPRPQVLFVQRWRLWPGRWLQLRVGLAIGFGYFGRHLKTGQWLDETVSVRGSNLSRRTQSRVHSYFGLACCQSLSKSCLVCSCLMNRAPFRHIKMTNLCITFRAWPLPWLSDRSFSENICHQACRCRINS